MKQTDLFGFPEPADEELACKSPEYLYEKYKWYYDNKHKEYERELAAMGKMAQENRTIPDDVFARVENALSLQYYITAKPDANPHQYCLRRNWRGNTSFIEAAKIIRDYGYVEWFWRKPYMMLNVGEFKYWSMGWPLDVTMLINRTMIKPCSRADLLRLR
jgi:hypothetical protein